MTRDVTQHPAFREAVEAAASAVQGRGDDLGFDMHQVHGNRIAVAAIKAALPFLERLYRETCAEELEAEADRRGAVPYADFLRQAAAFLRRADA